MKPQRRIVTLMTVLFFMLGMVALAPPGGAAQGDNVTVTDTVTETSTATDQATETETSTSTETATATETEEVIETPTTAVPPETPTTETVTETATVTETETVTETATETATTTETATVTVPPTEPTQPTDNISSILVVKLFCRTINEQAGPDENPCVGRVEEAEGTSVTFVLTDVATGDDFPFDVQIEEFEGETSGVVRITNVPFGTYALAESVPGGYDAFAVALDESQQAAGATLTLTVGAEEPLALFVNVPLGQETQTATTVPQTPAETPAETPTTGPQVPTEMAPVMVPTIVIPPSVPTVPVQPPVLGVSTLPSTGDGPLAQTDWALWLMLAAAPLLLGAAVGVQRRNRR